MTVTCKRLSSEITVYITQSCNMLPNKRTTKKVYSNQTVLHKISCVSFFKNLFVLALHIKYLNLSAQSLMTFDDHMRKVGK